MCYATKMCKIAKFQIFKSCVRDFNMLLCLCLFVSIFQLSGMGYLYQRQISHKQLQTVLNVSNSLKKVKKTKNAEISRALKDTSDIWP